MTLENPGKAALKRAGYEETTEFADCA